MEITAIGAEKLKALYETRLREDFPADELRPYPNMRYLSAAGLYHCFVCREGGKDVGYAFFLVFGGCALLDYYAVFPTCRGRGVGTRFFAGLKEAAAELGASYILIEAESMESVCTAAQREERARRFRFYAGCGCRETSVYSMLFGVEYRILVYPLTESPADKEALAALERLYRKMLSSTIGESESEFRKVCRCFLREEAKSRKFERELGRAVTFLNRSRNRFMGEHLREYGFSGAMYAILLHVNRHPGITQDNIATCMYIDKSNAARRIKQLEELDYIRRETDTADRRQNNLYLTEKGEALLPLVRSYLAQWVQGVTADLTQGEREQLLELLLKITGQTNKNL